MEADAGEAGLHQTPLEASVYNVLGIQGCAINASEYEAMVAVASTGLLFSSTCVAGGS